MRDEPTNAPHDRGEDLTEDGQVPEDAIVDLAPDDAEQSGVQGGVSPRDPASGLPTGKR